MKKDTHPTYFPEAKIVCACGNTIITGSTQKEMQIELCSNCHPFFTGKQKVVDTQGRVERFQRMMKMKDTIKSKTTTKSKAAKKK